MYSPIHYILAHYCFSAQVSGSIILCSELFLVDLVPFLCTPQVLEHVRDIVNQMMRSKYGARYDEVGEKLPRVTAADSVQHASELLQTCLCNAFAFLL